MLCLQRKCFKPVLNIQMCKIIKYNIICRNTGDMDGWGHKILLHFDGVSIRGGEGYMILWHLEGV